MNLRKKEQDKAKLVVMLNIHIFNVAQYVFVKLDLQNSSEILDSSGRARLFSKLTDTQYFVSMRRKVQAQESRHQWGFHPSGTDYRCYRVNLCAISPAALHLQQKQWNVWTC